MIPDPHGGRLVDRRLPASEVERRTDEFSELPRLTIDIGQAYDAAQIADGAYSPLEGFMDRTTLESVVETGRLPSGLPWPIPIFLSPAGPTNQRTLADVRPGDEVGLVDPNGDLRAILHLEETYPLPRRAICERVFGTTDPRHPNVVGLATTGPVAAAGRIDLLRPPSVPFPALEQSPAGMRETFRRKGWNSVVGYQTRNVPHLGHEHLQRLALEREEVDGLLIHPVVGPLKTGDYRPEVVLAAYEALISRYYPADRVVLATLTIAMRYAGPRAALFLAIVRQNFGCSHYIVGRDQAGVGTYYDPYACHAIFDRFPLGITPLKFREYAYCPRCRGMVSDKTCGHPAADRVSTSQTRVRRAIAENGPLPLEILRPEVTEILRRGDALRPTAPARSSDGETMPSGGPGDRGPPPVPRRGPGASPSLRPC